MRTLFHGVAVAMGVLVLPVPARAQSADLVLCDRVAVDPSDLDKPADVTNLCF
ncbi:hypothetical protein [Bradyrhizobium sp. AUGA SZCCT0182]|uniref:hypothetical protein n=1 Tax=Bradyrhizobium sp. AUGA SZCCT0182 TaxID=2807667 RepID=UPI00390C9D5C